MARSRKPTRCYECGGNVMPIAKKGRMEPYKNMKLEIPADLEIPTCDKCGEELLDDNLIKKLNAALEEPYSQEVQLRIQRSLDVVCSSLPQGQLESLLGLSHGYLSKLRAGKNASPMIANLLLLLADNPEHNIKTLKRSWIRRLTR